MPIYELTNTTLIHSSTRLFRSRYDYLEAVSQYLSKLSAGLYSHQDPNPEGRSYEKVSAPLSCRRLLKSFENDKFLQQQLDNAVKNVRRVVVNRYKFWMEKGKPTFRLRSWDDMSQSPS